MNVRPEKILAIQFKYFGDAVMLIPALRALRQHFPQAEIHLLVPAEFGPIFEKSPWLTRLWAMPRRRGKPSLGQTLPMIRALQCERFDRVVDFGGNDRGAILSLLSGGKQRLGWARPGKLLGSKWFCNQRVVSPAPSPHETLRLSQLLAYWNVPPPASLELEIHADEALAGAAVAILPASRAILFHVGAGGQKKEWPAGHWAELHRLARAAGRPVFFTTPAGQREGALMAAVQKLAPEAAVLPPVPKLALFLAVLKRASLFVSGDTGPMHFAAGVGVPTLSIFGPTLPAMTAPIGRQHRSLATRGCTCAKTFPVCQRPGHCMAEIRPEQVMAILREMVG